MCSYNMSVPKLAVAALVLLVATRTFRPCRAHPRLLVTSSGVNAGSDDGERLTSAHGGPKDVPMHHPDYTVAIASNPFRAEAGKNTPQGQPREFNTDDDLQTDGAADSAGDEVRVKRGSEDKKGTSAGNPEGSEWKDMLAEASEVADDSVRHATAEEDDPSVLKDGNFGERIRKLDPPAQEQHFFPSFASIFSPPAPRSPPPSLLGYNHESSISRPRHHSNSNIGSSGRSHHFGNPHHHYPGFESYPSDDEDDTFGLFQGSEHGTLSPRPPLPILQPPRTKLSYQSARQQQASANTDTKHTGLLGSGNFAVIRGGTFYEEKDRSASELRGNYYSDPFGNGHGGPNYNSGSYHRGLPSNPRPRPGREHFADFRDFADITAPKPAFSQLVVVYAANQNGSNEEVVGKNGSSTNATQRSPPRNIIERLRLLDGEDEREESESQQQDKDSRDHVVLWDGEGGMEEEEDEMVGGGGDDERDEEEEELPPVVVRVAPRPNNINEKLKLLDVEQPNKEEEEPQKKGKGPSLGKRKLALMKEKGKWVSSKSKRLPKDLEPLLALS